MEKEQTENQEKISKEQLRERKKQMDGYAKRESLFIMAGITLCMLVFLYCGGILVMIQELPPAIGLFTYGMIGIDFVIVVWLSIIIYDNYKKGSEAIKAHRERELKRRQQKSVDSQKKTRNNSFSSPSTGKKNGQSSTDSKDKSGGNESSAKQEKNAANVTDSKQSSNESQRKTPDLSSKKNLIKSSNRAKRSNAKKR